MSISSSPQEAFAAVLALAAGGREGDDLDRAIDAAGLGDAAAADARAIAARRGGLAQAVSDIATDLAAIRDVEEVLRAIVQRTRAITGADMAYLSLNDYDRGETYIRQSDGVRTEAYREIRMPLGTGVLGKAASGAAVARTRDYAHDDRIVHLDAVDGIVREEGVRSILGVPMNVHGRVHGALLIADRTDVDYPPETIEAVDIIARQAAVAIDYSERLAGVGEALRALDAEHDAGAERVRALQGLLDLDRRMVESVARRQGPDEILGLLGDVYGGRVELLRAGEDPSDPLVGSVVRLSAAAGRSLPTELEERPVTVRAIEVGQRLLGHVIVHAAVPSESRDILDRAALYLAVASLMDTIEADAAARSENELFDDLVRAGGEAGPALAARLSAAGISPRRPISLVVADSGAGRDEAVAQLRAALPGAIVGAHDGHVCALHQGEPAAERVRDALATAGAGARAGTARVRGLDVSRAHRAAELALASLRLIGGDALDAAGLGALGVLLEAEGDGRLAAPLLEPIAPLAADQRGAELVRTAWAVLEFGPSVPAVAERLFIHPNTLRQRMQRISGLLGDDWRTGRGRLDLHLALRAAMLREQAGSGSQ